MDYFELHNLVKRYHKLDNEEDSNIEFLNQFSKEEIIKTLQEHGDLFKSGADEFQYALRETFVKHKKLNFKNLELTTKIKHLTITNSQYAYVLQMFIKIKTQNSISSIRLPECLTLRKHELTDKDFLQNQFTISLLPILLSTYNQNTELIHSACWNIVMNNIVENLNTKI